MGSQTTPKLPQNYPKQIELFVYSNNTNNTILQKKLPQRPQKQFSKDFGFIGWGRIRRACLISATIESLK